MSFLLRDATQADIPAIADIYRESVLNGVASYEIVPPSEAEMALRFSAIVGQQYPYIAATDADGTLLG
ncbi:N-acetyltransferase family protein, partial [Rhizobium ruizarguesonis]